MSLALQAASRPTSVHPEPHQHCLRHFQECLLAEGLRLPWLLRPTETVGILAGVPERRHQQQTRTPLEAFLRKAQNRVRLYLTWERLTLSSSSVSSILATFLCHDFLEAREVCLLWSRNWRVAES